MAEGTHLIESYFPPSPPPTGISQIGDGFTLEELTQQSWTPSNAYEPCEIGSLNPGPGCITIIGRIVNIYHLPVAKRAPRSAAGCLKMIVRDDTSSVTLRLWYAKTDYEIRLGQLVSVWAAHVSNGGGSSLASRAAPLLITIFPERDRSCHFMPHEKDVEVERCREPFYRQDESKEVKYMMTVKNYIDGGHALDDASLLVYVKIIGPEKNVTTKKGFTTQVRDVHLADDTGEIVLSLWGYQCKSVQNWTPAQTILLIRSPLWRGQLRPSFQLSSESFVEVDPNLGDAQWLRKFARGIKTRSCVNESFPDELFEPFMTDEPALKALYTLASLDEFARAAPDETFVGFLSLLIVELNLVSLFQKQMLLCIECCSTPVHANSTPIECRNCGRSCSLRFNPKIIGRLIDETGCVASGMMLWSDDAWKQLLGLTADDAMNISYEQLHAIEKRLVYHRLTIVFGWCAASGKIAVRELKVGC